MSPADRYARQRLIPGWDQQRLESARGPLPAHTVLEPAPEAPPA